MPLYGIYFKASQQFVIECHIAYNQLMETNLQETTIRTYDYAICIGQVGYSSNNILTCLTVRGH